MSLKRTYSKQELTPWQECISDADSQGSEEPTDDLEDLLEELRELKDELRELLQQLKQNVSPTTSTAMQEPSLPPHFRSL